MHPFAQPDDSRFDAIVMVKGVFGPNSWNSIWLQKALWRASTAALGLFASGMPAFGVQWVVNGMQGNRSQPIPPATATNGGNVIPPLALPFT